MMVVGPGCLNLLASVHVAGGAGQLEQCPSHFIVCLPPVLLFYFLAGLNSRVALLHFSWTSFSTCLSEFLYCLLQYLSLPDTEFIFNCLLL